MFLSVSETSCLNAAYNHLVLLSVGEAASPNSFQQRAVIKSCLLKIIYEKHSVSTHIQNAQVFNDSSHTVFE